MKTDFNDYQMSEIEMYLESFTRLSLALSAHTILPMAAWAHERSLRNVVEATLTLCH